MPVYKKVTLLGSGSFGKAFLVMEKGGDGTKFVLKSIDMSGMDAVAREETLNEAKVFACIPPHPFIVRYRRSYILEDQLCIVMEHCAGAYFGGDMHSRIQRQKKKNERFQEAQITLWLAQALLDCYLADLKPQNLFLNERDDLLIGDFGIAKVLDSTHSCARTTIGTPYYFSPELCQQHRYSFPSDVWSLGCIIYEMVSNALPHVLFSQLIRHSHIYTKSMNGDGSLPQS
ncbi:NEK kinase [Cyclospora cayetanensis]|uniref:non-specific serine/threonine protein kinase n=1 Tax=Cyclospora cayetanensis TaxID=88456 RepID=A0A1D3D3M5_9EIME|nr:NEK kinase [Cyclospora cayetanensis]